MPSGADISSVAVDCTCAPMNGDNGRAGAKHSARIDVNALWHACVLSASFFGRFLYFEHFFPKMLEKGLCHRPNEEYL
eukprot:15455190-Alexandrium_andersonii.AAC.1